MTHPTTLSEALEMVPEYIHLPIKRGHKIQINDEFYRGDMPLNGKVWINVGEHCATSNDLTCFDRLWKGREIILGEWRRPIPQEVREAMAQNLMLEKHRRYAMTNAFEAWLLIKGGGT